MQAGSPHFSGSYTIVPQGHAYEKDGKTSVYYRLEKPGKFAFARIRRDYRETLSIVTPHDADIWTYNGKDGYAILYPYSMKPDAYPNSWMRVGLMAWVKEKAEGGFEVLTGKDAEEALKKDTDPRFDRFRPKPGEQPVVLPRPQSKPRSVFEDISPAKPKPRRESRLSRMLRFLNLKA